MNPIKIVFLDAGTLFDVPNLMKLSSLGKVVYHKNTTPEETVLRLAEAEIAITNKVVINKEVMQQCKHLKLICIAATGTNNIDKEFASEMGIEVKNVVNYSTESVAQVVFTMLLSLIHKPSYYDQFVKLGNYSRNEFFTHVGKPFWQLAVKRLGIIGLGNIGNKVATIAKAFGMEVVYCSVSGKQYESEYKRIDLKELLQTSDVISIHSPLTDQTKGLIHYDNIKLMKPHAILLNTARGGIIKENDLAKSLNENLIAGAGIDVFEKEPIDPQNPLLSINDPEKLILFPHIAWASLESRTLLVEKIYENIVSYQNNMV